MTSGGWLAQGYTWNPYRPVDKFNGPMTWMDRANEYQLNELYWYFGKAADTGGCGFDYGYRVDLLYGTNYRWDTAAGLETDWNSGQFYGLGDAERVCGGRLERSDREGWPLCLPLGLLCRGHRQQLLQCAALHVPIW